MKIVLHTTGAIAIGCLLTLISCTSSPSGQNGTLTIKIIDAPAAFEQEVIVIHRIELHRSGSPADAGWRVVSGSQGIVGTFDLLQFRNGANQIVTQNQVPAGKYDGIRMTLDGSYIVLPGHGTNTPLDLAADVIGGYVIQYSLSIAEGNSYELILDFDAFHSVQQTGPNQYTLTPAVRVQDAAVAGSITGAVVSADKILPLNGLISSSVGTSTVATFPDTSNGSFVLGALPEGTYSITISPSDSASYRDTTISGIQVIRLKQSAIGAIKLLHK